MEWCFFSLDLDSCWTRSTKSCPRPAILLSDPAHLPNTRSTLFHSFTQSQNHLPAFTMKLNFLLAAALAIAAPAMAADSTTETHTGTTKLTSTKSVSYPIHVMSKDS